MAYLEPFVSQQEAAQIAQRRRGEALRKIFGRQKILENIPLRGDGSLPCMELIWFPHYVVPIAVTSRRGDGVITVLVEGNSGAIAIVDKTDGIIEGKPPRETYTPKLTMAEATKIGRKKLARSIMTQRSRGAKPVLQGTGVVELLQYPYWVYYYERRPGQLDIRVVDGIAGSLAGSKTKIAILEAFSKI